MPKKLTPSAGSKRAGIVQIAARLGVSPSTVSRALRPETAHLVRADRRKQILDLADRQGFSPNPGARMLRRGINTSITVVIPLDENIFFSEFYGRFLAGVLHAAALREWNVQIRTLKRDPSMDLRETLQHIGIDAAGVIYLAERLSPEDLERLRTWRRPLVLTKLALPDDVDIRTLGIPVVGVDNIAGAQSAMKLLLHLGHHRIGLLLGPPTGRDACERKRGYLEAARAGGAETRPEWTFEGPFTTQHGQKAMEALLKCPELPTAICCASDEIACGAIGTIHAAGKRCPEDFSVVGFDDGLWASTCRPGLTTVRQPLAEMTERTVAAIVEAARSPGKPPPPVGSDLPASLVIRESTRALGAPLPASA